MVSIHNCSSEGTLRVCGLTNRSRRDLVSSELVNCKDADQTFALASNLEVHPPERSRK